MTERLQVYKCEVSGNMVEVLHAGVGKLFCCGVLMKNYVENSNSQVAAYHRF